MSTEMSERFLTAFCRLEDELRRITGSGNHESFSYLLDHVSRSNAAFSHFRDDLKEFAELRNAIVHKRIGDKPIAEPHPAAVERLEAIAEKILTLPTLEDHFRKQVSVCSPQDSLKHVLDILHRGRFNQIPVYSSHKLIGLLSTDTIVLWLADAFRNADYVDQGAKVKDILRFAASNEDFTVLSGKSSIFDAITTFDAAFKHGKHLKAIIITENGNNHEQPIGIITTLEIPRLISLVNPEPSSPIRTR